VNRARLLAGGCDAQSASALLHPVHLNMRALHMRHYLEIATVNYLYGENASQEKHDGVSAAIDSVIKSIKPNIDVMEKGMVAAIKFAGDRFHRANFLTYVDRWNATEKNAAMVDGFLRLARSRNKGSPHFDVVAAKLADSSAPLDMKINGTLYFLPCILGPEDFNRPFTLATRHGELILLFLSDSELCKTFCELSSEGMAEGYHVTAIPAVADSLDHLKDFLGRRLEPGIDFVVAIEGTELFDNCIAQQSDGSIFDVEPT
jgi:hypothetical protein